jgi:hypothetical protein
LGENISGFFTTAKNCASRKYCASSQVENTHFQHGKDGCSKEIYKIKHNPKPVLSKSYMPMHSAALLQYSYIDLSPNPLISNPTNCGLTGEGTE